MKLLTKEDRENLFAEYEQLHAEIRERNQRTWLINTILITGSLLVTFQSEITSNLIRFVSLMLVLIAFLLHVSAYYVSKINFDTIGEIRNDLGLTRTNRMYKSKIEGKLWNIFRGMLPWTLFIFLIVVYLLLFLNYL